MTNHFDEDAEFSKKLTLAILKTRPEEHVDKDELEKIHEWAVFTRRENAVLDLLLQGRIAMRWVDEEFEIQLVR
jgi:hypothetical protein